MSDRFPAITIQCDWNEVIRLPKTKAWISSKLLNQKSVHGEVTTAINESDGKIKINVSPAYQYLSHSNLSLALKHVSGLKVVFVAATKVHKIHNNAVLSVNAAENALVVSSCEADKLLVWDSRTSDVHLDLKGHGGPVYKCRFFPSGVVIISSGADGSSRIWSAESGVNPVILKGHTMAVTDLAIVEKGRNVVTVSRDGAAKLWDVGESHCLANIAEECGSINCCGIATTADDVMVNNEREVGTTNKLLIIGCESGQVICAHVAKRQIMFTVQLPSECNACVILEQSVVVGCNDGKIVLISLEDGSILKECHESASPVLCLTSLTNNLFVVGRQDGRCTIHSFTHEPTRVELTGSDCDGVRDISFNGKWIFTACRDSFIRKYDYNQVLIHFK